MRFFEEKVEEHMVTHHDLRKSQLIASIECALQFATEDNGLLPDQLSEKLEEKVIPFAHEYWKRASLASSCDATESYIAENLKTRLLLNHSDNLANWDGDGGTQAGE
jgi:hypothetical protein